MPAAYPRISTPHGFRVIRPYSHELDYGFFYIDKTWSKDVAFQHKFDHINARDVHYPAGNGSAETPNQVRARAGAVGSGYPKFTGYVNGTYRFETPNSGVFPVESFVRAAVDPTKFIMDDNDTYLHLPTSPAWIQSGIDRAKNETLDKGTGWDGIFFDNIGRFGATTQNMADGAGNFILDGLGAVISSKALDPRTGLAYTTADWMRDCVHMALSVLEGLRGQGYNPLFMFNGWGNGRERYFGTDGQARTDVLNVIGDGGLFETFLRNSGSLVTAFISESQWKLDINAILDARFGSPSGAPAGVTWNKLVTTSTKLWVTATQAQKDQWERYSWASHLMAADGYTAHGFEPYVGSTNDRTSSIHDRGERVLAGLDSDLGRPIDNAGLDVAALRHGAAPGWYYLRYFENGAVLCNPAGTGGGNVTGISLSGTYQAPSGRLHPGGITTPISSIDMPVNDGAILLKAP